MSRFGEDREYEYQNGGGDGHAGGGGYEPSSGASVEGSAVFITNLQWWTTDVELEQLCSPHGPVQAIRFIEDKACAKSRGMAVVEYADPEAASRCIAGLNGRDINGRPCRVNYQNQGRGGGVNPASTSGQGGGGTGHSGGLAGRGQMAGGRGGRGGGMGGGRMGGGRGMDMEGGGMMPDMAAMGMMGGSMGGMVMPGMMGIAPMIDMSMMQGMQGMVMPGMMAPFGMGGMQGYKPPPPPGAPPPKRE